MFTFLNCWQVPRRTSRSYRCYVWQACGRPVANITGLQNAVLENFSWEISVQLCVVSIRVIYRAMSTSTGTSAVCIRNNAGPTTRPWGTLPVTDDTDERLLVNINMLYPKERTQFMIKQDFELQMHFWRRSIKIEWSTVSNAADRSSSSSRVICARSADINTSDNFEDSCFGWMSAAMFAAMCGL